MGVLTEALLSAFAATRFGFIFFVGKTRKISCLFAVEKHIINNTDDYSYTENNDRGNDLVLRKHNGKYAQYAAYRV